MNASDEDRVYGSGNQNLPSNTITKERLRDYYDRFYEHSEFGHYNEPTTRKILRTLLNKAGVGNNAKVLDVGCATGFYTEQLHLLGVTSIGVDISRVGISRGRSNYPHLPFVVADAFRLPLVASSFDALFMSGCSLTNTRDFEAIQSFFLGLTDYLKDNGSLIVLSATDFSGRQSPSNEWIYHTYAEVLQYVDRNRMRVRGPFITHLRLLSKFKGLTLNGVASFFFKILPGKRRWSVVYFIGKKDS